MLQAVGIIAAVGDAVTNLEIGTPAAVMTFGSYAEFMMVLFCEYFTFNEKHKCFYNLHLIIVAF